jgi:hypothetical protein
MELDEINTLLTVEEGRRKGIDKLDPLYFPKKRKILDNTNLLC